MGAWVGGEVGRWVGRWVGVGGTFGVGVGRKIREKTAHLFLNLFFCDVVKLLCNCLRGVIKMNI